MLSCCLYNSVAQSDEGCRKDLFKTSQKKGVGYLLLITAFQYFPLGSVRRVQRKMPLHVTSVMTALCNGSTGPLYNLHTSPFIHKNKNLAQDQPEGRKSSVDAHGVSSCLGCSRILRHLISFLTSSQDFRSRKIMEKTMGQEIAATPQNKASQAKKNIHCLLMGVPTGPDVMNPLPTTCFSHH